MSITDAQKLEVVLKKSLFDRLGGIFSSLFKIVIVVLIIGLVVGVSTIEDQVTGGENVVSDYTYQPIDVFYRPEAINEMAQKVAMINFSGVITSMPSESAFPEDFISRDETISLLMNLVEDQSIAAILLVVNSPGGEVLATEQITGMIDVVNTRKPVYVLIENIAASGGYYISTSAQKIYAYPESLIGNIGVRIDIPNISGMLEKVGVDMQVVDSGEFKTMGSPFREMSEEEAQIFQVLVDESYEKFVDRVASGRSMDREKALSLSDGRIYSGVQAMENGLVDKTVGSLLDLSGEISGEIGDEIQFIQVSPVVSPWEEILMQVKSSVLSPVSEYISSSQGAGMMVQ